MNLYKNICEIKIASGLNLSYWCPKQMAKTITINPWHLCTTTMKRILTKELSSINIFYKDNLDVGNPFNSALHSIKLISNIFLEDWGLSLSSSFKLEGGM